MSEHRTTLERVIERISDDVGLDPEDITASSTFQEDLGFDSLDEVEVIMSIEEEFELEIADDEAQRLNTVGELVQFVDRLVAAKQLKGKTK